MIESVACEWALGTHMTLTQTTELLIQAERGHKLGVVGLEPSIKPTTSFIGILRQLNKRYPLTRVSPLEAK